MDIAGCQVGDANLPDGIIYYLMIE